MMQIFNPHHWMRLVERFSSVYSNPSQPSRSHGKLILCVSAQDAQSSCRGWRLEVGRLVAGDRWLVAGGWSTLTDNVDNHRLPYKSK